MENILPYGEALLNSVGEFIGRSARMYPEKIALIFGEERWTFIQLDQASSAVAAGLESLGLSRGDCISLYSPNCVEWIIAYYAVLKCGATVNPLNSMLTPEEALFAMNDCNARAVIGSAEKIEPLLHTARPTPSGQIIAFGPTIPDGAISFASLLESNVRRHYPIDGIRPEDPCMIAYTSGTTGYPKGALLSHRAIMMNVAMTAVMHVRTAQDIVVSALPCTHVYGNVAMQTMIAYGGTLVLHRVFDAANVLASIERHRATLLEGVPTMYAYLLNAPDRHRYDLSTLTRATVGGQGISEATMREVEGMLGCALIELWGMTELGGLGLTHTLYGPKKYGSIGIPLPHLAARIVGEDGVTVVATGETGELQIQGPVTMNGYIGNPFATSETILADGWLRTGDLARMDQDGFIYVVDRLKDVIITGGFNIYPAELERVLNEHPGVAMSAVGRVDDDVKGELAKAYVVARQNVTLDLEDLDRHCRARLAAYKVPRLYQIVDDLPKTSSGKITRKDLHRLG
jgi:long-chain acyl-CoA synthetase